MAPPSVPAQGPARTALWLLGAAGVYLVVREEPQHLATAIAAVVGVAALVAVARNPLRATLFLVAALPFDLYAEAALYRAGVPAQLLRSARFWPEVVLAGLAIAAVGLFRRGAARTGWRRLDGLDMVALAFVAIGTLYLVLPGPFVTAPIGAHVGLYARALGWRTDVMYVAFFIVARRLPLRSADGERVMRWALAVGTIVAALGLVEFAAPGTWDRLAAGTLQVPRYQQSVLAALPVGSSLTNVEVFGNLAGHRLVRVGSVLDYESLGFYLALGLGIGAELWSRGRGGRWIPPALVVIALGLLVTQDRSGILAGAVAVGLALRHRPRVGAASMRRMAAAAGVLVVVGGGLYVFGGVGARLGGDRTSNQAHSVEIRQGLQALVTYPLGRGLATAGPQYKRAALSTAGLSTYYAGPATGIAVTDDQWLAIGTELGLAGLAVYVAMALTMIVRLGEAGRRGAVVGSAARNALVGILIGGTFLQPFINQAVSLTLFLLVGLGVGGVPSPSRPATGASASVSTR